MRLCFGEVDGWLIDRLTGSKLHCKVNRFLVRSIFLKNTHIYIYTDTSSSQKGAYWRIRVDMNGYSYRRTQEHYGRVRVLQTKTCCALNSHGQTSPVSCAPPDENQGLPFAVSRWGLGLLVHMHMCVFARCQTQDPQAKHVVSCKRCSGPECHRPWFQCRGRAEDSHHVKPTHVAQ